MWTNNPNLNPNIINWFVEMVTGREQTSTHPRSTGDLDTWKQRNERIFMQILKPPQSRLAEIHDEALLWSLAGAKLLAPLIELIISSNM